METATEVAAEGPGPTTALYLDPLNGIPTAWPAIGWEWSILQKANHSLLPRVLDHFVENGQAYVVEEQLGGRPLWDAWDDAGISARDRCEWLAEIAAGLKALHDAGAILEALRPDMVAINEEGRPVLTDCSDLLPLPVPPDRRVRGTLHTAPELVVGEEADARSSLYGFGAMLYALHLGRELTEMDFDRPGSPKPFVLRFPDAHPTWSRIIMKTFVRDRSRRFPTEDASREDPSGFTELARALRLAGRALDQVRLDVAMWSNTGMVRTGNEDACSVLHAAAWREESVGDRALAILADGMGGNEAGEVASALALDAIKGALIKSGLKAGYLDDPSSELGQMDVEACKGLIERALNEANDRVYQASRKPGGHRGMGCTAEVVLVDAGRAVIGHVGDSRVYHFSRGKLVQITRDHTLVNRLVELGQLSPEEAEDHPRKNELQQAIGGQPYVEPALYDTVIQPGDWIVVCSDGLTNHVDHATLAEMIQRADSAEMCARRLVNLANLYGGSDNCSVIAIRAT